MPESKKSYRFNLSRAVYAVITKDDASGVTHDAIKELCGPMQVQWTFSSAQGPLFGGGVKTANEIKITGGALKLDLNKVAIEDRAIMGGHTYSNGVITEKAGDSAPYIAVGYEVEETEGDKEYVWCFKGKVMPIGSNVQQSTDNINYSTDSLEILFVAREFDKKFREYADTANSDFTQEMAAEFLDTIPDGTLTTGA